MKGANNSAGDQMIKLAINLKKPDKMNIQGLDIFPSKTNSVGYSPVRPADIQPACPFLIVNRDPRVRRLHYKKEIKGACL